MSINIMGLDNGYNFTKSSEGVTFLSTIKEGHDFYNNVLEVKIGEKNYIVGESNGEYVVDSDKLKSEAGKELLKVTTLTAIGLSYPEEKFIEVNLVGGLPVAYFSKQKEDFKKLLKELDGSIIKINKLGYKQTIKINDILIFPQSTGLIFEKNIKDESVLVIDIGGGTWDISQFNGMKLEKKATYTDGMLVLYSKIAQYLNSTYYTKYLASDIYSLINRGYFTAEGKKHSIDVIEDIIREHTRQVLTQLKRDFDTTNVDNIFVIGGGAKELISYIKESIPSVILEKNAQFNNANNFKLIGEMKIK
ncbi:MAG: StbA protein [Clostridium paraputrificum]